MSPSTTAALTPGMPDSVHLRSALGVTTTFAVSAAMAERQKASASATAMATFDTRVRIVMFPPSVPGDSLSRARPRLGLGPDYSTGRLWGRATRFATSPSAPGPSRLDGECAHGPDGQHPAAPRPSRVAPGRPSAQNDGPTDSYRPVFRYVPKSSAWARTWPFIAASTCPFGAAPRSGGGASRA